MNGLDKSGKRSHLTPTALSQYVVLDSCDRYLYFYLHKSKTEQLTKHFANEAELQGTPWLPVQPLSPLLTEVGERTERDVLQNLKEQGFQVDDLGQYDARNVLEVLGRAVSDGEERYFYQVPMRGILGSWQFEGRADLIRVKNGIDGLEVLVIDIKASRKDKVQHRLQVAVYVLMLQQMLEALQVTKCNFTGAILRRTVAGQLQNPVSSFTFELEPYLNTVLNLTSGENSPLERVDKAENLSQLHYYLGPRCEGCAFGPVCLAESAERQDLSLIPFLESSDKRALNHFGITDLAQLTALKKFVTTAAETSETGTAAKPKVRLEVATGQEELVEKLGRLWPLAPRLDRLIQRAAVNLRHFDKTTPARRYFIDRSGGKTGRSGRSNLPDDKLYPDLIKVFIDVQFDYLEDKIYLVGALIASGDANNLSQLAVVRSTSTVPDADKERTMLIEWVSAVYAAVVETANRINDGDADKGVRLHLYLYNRRDQKVLLDALRRHLDTFATLPTFYHLLTDTPALNQSAIAFLHDEVRERLNLPGPLSSLVVVSRQLGFKWQDAEGNNFAHSFRTGIFDFGLRRNDGVWQHTAARFYSGIPLEYAYAAWNCLPHITKSYAGVTLDQLKAFEAHRLRALHHIETSFPYKNSYLQKEPIHLPGISAIQPEQPVLAHVLEEFLHIEQYTQLQQHLELFTKPVLRRMEEGRALLVRCTDLETTPLTRRRKQVHASFLIELDQLNIYSQTAIQMCKLKEGDFVTLSPVEDDAQPWKIVGGRLARIEEISGGWIKLELSGSTLGQGQSSAFRYFHHRDLLPQPGQFYMIDEMVDNLNGDKLLEACRHAEHNTLYHYALIENTNNVSRDKSVPNSTDYLEFFTGIVNRIEAANGREFTADQLEVVVNHIHDFLFLVQGPPGTGKSYTLSWAVLSRIYLAVALDLVKNPELEGASRFAFRVLVSSQTHNAVEIVLENIAKNWKQLLDFVTALEEDASNTYLPALKLLSQVKIYKAGGDEKRSLPAEVTYLDPWYREQVKAALDGEVEGNSQTSTKSKVAESKKKKKLKDTETLISTRVSPQLLVVGATPGNLYNVMKEYYGRGKLKQNIIWDETGNKFFDLLVLDEASQMNLPHALLAAGWLKPQSQVILVGDHRQLAPILAHGWQHEEHLPTLSTQPYRSVFQYFLDNGWTRIALSESFRLHSTQAAFLAEHIYHQDGVGFHSNQQKLLPKLLPDSVNKNAVLEKFLDAVFHPDYPVVIVEHNESSSLQYNELELNIITPLLNAAVTRLGLEGKEGIGVVVPHRAQKAALRERFPVLAKAGAIDTVERFQGAERDLIIVSTTASDPEYIASEAEFLLSPNRFTVALSRPRSKLIVVASSNIFQFISAHLELFEQSLLWKKLSAAGKEHILWSGNAGELATARPSRSNDNLKEINNVQLKVYGF